MNQELFSEIAIEAIAPRKNLTFSTSEGNIIYAYRLDADTTRWTLTRGSQRKSFISRNGADEMETVTIMAIDFFGENETY